MVTAKSSNKTLVEMLRLLARQAELAADDGVVSAALNESAERIIELDSMCRRAGDEIASHWDAHVGDDGLGPSTLVSRLKGELPPDLYSEYAPHYAKS